MSLVRDLRPGDIVSLQGVPFYGIFVVSYPHPKYVGLTCVVWRLSNGEWSFDALLDHQYIGEAKLASNFERHVALETALRMK